MSTGETYTTDYIYDSALYRLERVIKESPIKLKSLLITPAERHALADEQLTFTISGTKDDGSVLTDEVLNNATWTVDSSIIKLNTSQGKTITAVIPRAAWDTMLQSDVITVTASLQGKVVEAKVYKGVPVLQNLSIIPTETPSLADEQITFTISGTMNDGSVATDEMLNKATWSVSPSTMKLNESQGKTITGIIPRAEWDAMPQESAITITATLQGKVVEAKVYKGVPVLQSIAITPKLANIEPDKPITFTIAGTMNDGSSASDDLLNETTWIITPIGEASMTFDTTQGKSITGIMTRDEWNKMLPLDYISVKATLQDKTVEAQVRKIMEGMPVLQNLSISPLESTVRADEKIIFAISGTMDDGSAAPDKLLNTATWTVSSSKMTLYETQGKMVIGVIPKAEWDEMSETEVITVRATLSNKEVSSFIYKYTGNDPVLESLSITPSNEVIKRGESKVFTLSGIMSDGTEAPDSLLETASWRVNNIFTLSKSTGKTVNVSYRPGIGSADYIEEKEINSQYDGIIPPKGKALEATIGDITAGADISTGVIGFTTGNLIAFLESENINNIDSVIDNQTDSIPIDRTTTYFIYDNNGNMISQRTVKAIGEEVTNYNFNELNQLVQISNPSGTTSYTYNPSGLRETKTSGGEQTKYYYDGQNVIIETINNNFSARNIYGINPIARETNGSKLYYLYNGHADVVAMVDSSGNIINSYKYDIYGNIKEANESGIENPIRYAGQYYDDESGLYYLKARYYDPGLMRFISEDVYKGDVKDPLSLNLYVYCAGNPIKLVDIDGHSSYDIKTHNYVVGFLYHYLKIIKKRTDITINFFIPNAGTYGIDGYADLTDLDTKEIWEIKPISCSSGEYNEMAREQLKRYLTYAKGIPGESMPELNGILLPYGKDQYIKLYTTPSEIDSGLIYYSLTDKKQDDKVFDLTTLKEKENDKSYQIIKFGAGVTGAYVIYRVVRFLPSLIPGFWPTIPANAVCP